MMQDRIVICHFVNLITGTADGVYTHIYSLLKNMDRKKFRQILVYQGVEKIKKEIEALDILVIELSSLKKKYSLRTLFELKKIVIENRIDIIHTHMIKPYLIAGLLNLTMRKRMIFNYHGLFINSDYYHFYEKMLLKMIHSIIALFRGVDIAVCPSKTSMSILQAETNLFKKILFYYNSLSLRKFSPQNPSLIELLNETRPEYFIVGIVARMEIEKRVDIALGIIHSLSQKGYKIKFFFFGDGPLIKQMYSLAERLNIHEECEFLGFVENVEQYFKYFDCLLFTSDWEGLPISLWEAMQNRVPVVSTDVGGMKEILLTEQCGIIYPRRDIAAGADAIIKLYNNPELRKKMGDNGNKALLDKYSIEKFTTFFEELYTDLIEINR